MTDLYDSIDDKAPTTPMTFAIIDGIRIDSRYRKRDEFEEMARAIGLLSQVSRMLIARVFCDSKAGASYTVTLRGDTASHTAIAGAIAHELDQAFRAQGGHNGIWFDDCSIVIEPWWSFDEVG
jgi:hypothetical protein